MKRTTIVLDETLFQHIKATAARQGVSMKLFVTTLLKRGLHEKKTRPSYRLAWKPIPGDLRPGVRIDSRETLYHFLDKDL